MLIQNFNKAAFKESLTDTILATFINFPMNFVLIWLAFQAEMTAFQTTVFCTAILFVIALFRKYYIRIHFENKNGSNGTAKGIRTQEEGDTNA